MEITTEPGRGVVALKAKRPYCCSTYTSISATCDDACAFKEGGCYAAAGLTGLAVARLDEEAASLSALDVVRAEVDLIDGSFGGGQIPQDGARGGRDLRLHVGGDAGAVAGVELLAAVAERWSARGGGVVWTYTHAWRTILRSFWGKISTIASVETPAHVEEARSMGYAPALVVDRFPNKHRVFLVGANRFIPCPAETAQITCVDCRLCFDDETLLRRGDGIAFSTHGRDEGKANRRLDVLNNRGQMAFGF